MDLFTDFNGEWISETVNIHLEISEEHRWVKFYKFFDREKMFILSSADLVQAEPGNYFVKAEEFASYQIQIDNGNLWLLKLEPVFPTKGKAYVLKPVGDTKYTGQVHQHN